MLKATTIIASIGVAISAIMLFLTLAASNGAPQEAAGAAIALCFVIIPYCLHGLVWRAEMLNKPRL